MRIRKYLTYSWKVKNSTSYFAFLSFPCPFKCAKKFMLQNNPFSCLNAINYFYSLAAGIKINVFTKKEKEMVSLGSPFFCFHYDKLPCSVVLHHQALIKLPYNGIKSFFKLHSTSGFDNFKPFPKIFPNYLFYYWVLKRLVYLGIQM